jgi:hypothetical protein
MAELVVSCPVLMSWLLLTVQHVLYVITAVQAIDQSQPDGRWAVSTSRDYWCSSLCTHLSAGLNLSSSTKLPGVRSYVTDGTKPSSVRITCCTNWHRA